MWFCRISPVPYPMKKEFTATEEMLIQEMESFLRQEIRQAKIDRDKEIATLLENTVMQHVEDSNNSLHVRYLKKIISNLKQNDQPTKN